MSTDEAEALIQEELRGGSAEAVISREKWLSTVAQDPNLIVYSARTQAYLALYQHIRMTYPEERMIVFSSSLMFLDIIAEALRKQFQIDPVRFDGSKPIEKRQEAAESFKTEKPEIPMLVTIATGKKRNHRDVIARSYTNGTQAESVSK